MNYFHWIIPFLVLYILMGYYLGKSFKELIKIKSKYLYWGFIFALPIAAFITHSLFIGVIIHTFAFLVIKDIIVFIAKKFHIKGDFYKKIYANGLLVIVLALIFSIYGYYNAYDMRVKNYEIETIRKLEKDTTIMFVSDMHLGTIDIDYELKFLQDKVKTLKPDVLVLGGDIFDEYTSIEIKREFVHKLNDINTLYGIYMVEGNHDLFNKEEEKLLENSNITVLKDEKILIDDNYYLVGRLDKRRWDYETNYDRENYRDLIKDMDDSKPIVLLDHQPYIKDLKNNIVDLQLTGHTHNGQLFPFNLFLKYGLYKYRIGSKMIVSSGLGVWNIPIRTAGHSEIVFVSLKNKS